MTFQDDHLGQRQRIEAERKRQRGMAERALADSEKYNAVLGLFIVDDQLKRMVDAYVSMDDEARLDLARHAQVLLVEKPRKVAL